MAKRVAIIGAGGFVGRNLVQHLVSKGVTVLAVSRTIHQDHSKAYGLRSGLVPAALLPESYEELPSIAAKRIGGLDAIVNAVAYGVAPFKRDPSEMVRLNIAAPVALARVAAKMKAAFIHLGSSAEYAATQDKVPLLETALPETQRLYGTSKHAGTALSLIASKDARGRMAVLRLFNVFGRFEAPHRLYPSLLYGLSTGQEVAMSAGLQVRDFIHVEDVARAVESAIGMLEDAPDAFGDTFNISTGIGLSVREFALTVCEMMQAPRSLLKFGSIDLRPDDVPWLVGDNTKFRQATGWQPVMSLGKATSADRDELKRATIR